MKKDIVVLEKKLQRNQQKVKNKDLELRTTRDQVSQFKQKFRHLTEFLKKKGGIEMLNSLPNVSSYQNTQRNEFEEFIGFKFGRDGNESVFGEQSVYGVNQNKISIRGGKESGNGRPVIRGGNRTSSMAANQSILNQTLNQTLVDDDKLN